MVSLNCSTEDNLVFQLTSDKPAITLSGNISMAFSATSSSVSSLSGIGLLDFVTLSVK